MKKLIVMLAIIMVLCSCNTTVNHNESSASYNSTEEAVTETALPAGTDESDCSFNHFSSTAKRTDNAVYFVTDTYKTGQTTIMYYDKESGLVGPLCGKPECMHDSDTCNAYIAKGYPAWATGLSVYNNNLYWIAEDYTDKEYKGIKLYRMKNDGTERAEVRTLAAPDDSSDKNYPWGNQIFVLHKGYLFISGNTSETVENGEFRLCYKINAYSLDDPAKDWTIESFDSDGADYSINMQAVGNTLYYYLFSADYDSEGNIKERHISLRTASIDTMEKKTLSDTSVQFFPWEFWIEDQKVMISGDDGKVYQVSLQDGKLNELYDFSKECASVGASFAENLIIMNPYEYDKIYIHDFSGNLISSPMIPLSFSYAFCGADQDKLYYMFSDIENGTGDQFVEISAADGSYQTLWKSE